MDGFFTRLARFGRTAAFFTAAALVFALAACPNPSGNEDPEQYTITFNSHSGSEVAAITAEEGTAVSKPQDPTRDGYAFTGWHTAAEGGSLYKWPYTLARNVTMHAQWQESSQPQPVQHTITFNSQGGSTTAPVTANTGTQVPKPRDPAKDGYSFLGWFNAASGGILHAWPYTLTGDVTMYAQWQESAQPQPVRYTITFNSQGGSATAPITAATGTQVAEPGNPTRSGFTFQGWFSEASGGTLCAWPYVLTGDVTVYARWQGNDQPPPQRYAITFDSQGGSTVQAVTANAGTQVAKPGDPVRDGHAFQGWFNAASGGTLYEWPHALTGDATMYAQWQAVRYTITFDSHEGSAVAPITENAGTRVLEPNNPSRDGYAFLGWFSAASGGVRCAWPHVLTGNIIMHAHWQDTTLPLYTITFNSQEGSAVEAVTANAEAQIAEPNNPSRDGYTFLGWFSAASGGILYQWPHVLTGNITMYAQWQDTTLPQYTITFNSQGGAATAPITADTGTQVVEPGNPSRDGYAFQGWFNAASGGTLYQWPHALTRNITMYAQWQAVQYTITFNSHEGSAVPPVTANAGTRVSKPGNPARTGYAFRGWFSEASGGALYEWPHTLTGDVTMHAQWQAPQYTITFNSQGGSAVEAVTADTGTQVDKPDDPVRDGGYTFRGWFNTASGGALYQWPYTLTGNITMHAQWQAPALDGSVSIDGIYDISQAPDADALVLTAVTGSLGGAGDISYQWQRADSAAGSFADIDNALGETYTLTGPDQDKYIRLTVSRSGNSGTKSSAPVGPVKLPQLTGAVSINGDYDVQGGTHYLVLTADTDDLGGSGTIGYRWQRADSATGTFVNIASATNATYMLDAPDQGKFIRLTVIRAGYDATIPSEPVGPVELSTFTGTASIAGTPETHRVLTASVSNPSGHDTGINYQWEQSSSPLDGFVAIPGATGETYTLAMTNLDKYIRVRASRAGYYDTILSSQTTVVTQPATKTISIAFNYGAIAIIGSDGTNTIYKGSSAPNSVELRATGYTDTQWYIDGSDSSAGSGDSITLMASDYSVKSHSITFTGKKDGKLYSQVIPFTVKY
jgi:uncharacterized repeat protein (TIGR02543 family)